jgi:cytochrome P450
MRSTDQPSASLGGRKGDPDPYPNYAWLRQKAPVSAMYSPHGIGNTWLITSYELARAALADSRLSNDTRNSSDALHVDAAEDEYLARGLLDLDRPEHGRLRRLVSSAFSAQQTERWRPMVAQVCHAAIDDIVARGTADLVADFALPVPVAVIHEVLGVPATQRKSPERCFDLFYRGGLARPFDVAAYNELIAYTDDLIDYKRRHPGDDVTSLLLAQYEAGDIHNERELRSMVLGMLGAGHVTTVQFFGCAILRLMADPQAASDLVSGRVRWADGVNELLRVDAPIQATVYRYATEDFTIGDVGIRRGDAVLISLAAANRDPARFVRPDDLDLDGPKPSHLAFGHGAHLCLGAHLARLEGEVGLEILVRRLANLRLSMAADEVVWAYGPMLRGPRALPVTFTPGEVNGR